MFCLVYLEINNILKNLECCRHKTCLKVQPGVTSSGLQIIMCVFLFVVLVLSHFFFFVFFTQAGSQCSFTFLFFFYYYYYFLSLIFWICRCFLFVYRMGQEVSRFGRTDRNQYWNESLFYVCFSSLGFSFVVRIKAFTDYSICFSNNLLEYIYLYISNIYWENVVQDKECSSQENNEHDIHCDQETQFALPVITTQDVQQFVNLGTRMYGYKLLVFEGTKECSRCYKNNEHNILGECGSR